MLNAAQATRNSNPAISGGEIASAGDGTGREGCRRQIGRALDDDADAGYRRHRHHSR